MKPWSAAAIAAAFAESIPAAAMPPLGAIVAGSP
jgi:hypothetical protein